MKDKRGRSFWIAVHGTDGVGKSTIIRLLDQEIATAERWDVLIRHLRPGLLPPLARLFGKNVNQVGPVTDPHGSSPSGSVGSTLRLGWLLLDYILGYWLLVRPAIARPGTVLIFDRYAYDIYLDPRRFRIGMLPSSFSWVLKLVPQPDIVFCFYASPEIVLSRKRELPDEEVVRQLAEIRKLAQWHARSVLISTEGTEREVVERVLAAIESRLRVRIRGSNVGRE